MDTARESKTMYQANWKPQMVFPYWTTEKARKATGQ